MQNLLKLINISGIIISSLILFLNNGNVYAQWNTVGPAANRWAETDDFPPPFNIRSIGIGNFTAAGTNPLAALDINSNYLSPSPIFNQGEVFRTDCPIGLPTYWRMLRGGTQYGLLYNNTNSDFGMEATQGDIFLNTGGANERMRILGTNGFVGIGTATPQFRLHLENDGGILSSNNTFGSGTTIPTGLNNSLLIWNPFKASFRAGFDSGGNWDDINTGNYSAAFGLDNIASGEKSFAIGQGNNVSSINSFAGGFQNTVNSTNSFVFGTSNNLNGISSYVFGDNNLINSGGNLFIAGGTNTINDNGNYVFGQANFLDGRDAFTFGEGQTVSLNSIGWAVTMGKGSTNDAASSFALGSYLQTSGINSFALGELLQTTNLADHSFVLGSGLISANVFLTNNISNSLMVGFNSDVSTFTVRAPQTGGIGATGRVGIANSNPQNTLEITSNTSIPSGLRFTNLLSTATPVANPGAGVLSVDANGDVIYVTGSTGGTGIGNYCSQTLNPLTEDFEVLLDDFSYNFISDNVFGRVNIGDQNCGNFWPAKLYVYTSDLMTGMPFHTSTTAHIDGANLPLMAPVYASMNTVFNARALLHAGVYGSSVNANNDIFTPLSTGIGVYGTALQNDINIGVIGTSTDNNATINYGIYGEADNASDENWAGWFEGDVAVNGTPYILNAAQPLSDQNLKTNISTITNATDILEQLAPKEFYFNNANNYGFDFSSEKQYGFIAQDVEPILPELISEFSKGEKFDTLGNLVSQSGTFKTLNYQSFIAILTKGFQEQQHKMDSLENKLMEMYSQMNSCCNETRSFSQPTNVIEIDLTDKTPNIILDQNVPNPFAEQTTINYALTEGVQKAQMLFYNIEGKLIQSVPLSNAAGQGKINVFANDLSTGVYTYTLVVDGEIKGTKRMVKN